MAGRTLRATPSSTEDLHPWQVTLLEKLSALHSECFQRRMALTKTIQEFPALRGTDALDEIAYAARCAWNLSPAEAHDRAQQLLEPGPPEFTGTKDTCILSWSFADESLWRGLSDNKKIIRLARSMLTTGFIQSEPISSRTFDLRAADGVLADKLHFGDGQARGLAARLAYQFLLNGVRQSKDTLIGDPEIMRIMQSLILIPTVFTKSGDGTGEDLIVAQAVRQNVKASMTLPMNTMEWANMVLQVCKLKLGVSTQQTNMILQCLQRCTQKYDASPEVNAYDVEPVAKRARRGRRKSATAAALEAEADGGESKKKDEPDEDRLKIGSRRLKAINQVLCNAIKKSYENLQLHLVWAGACPECS